MEEFIYCDLSDPNRVIDGFINSYIFTIDKDIHNYISDILNAIVLED